MNVKAKLDIQSAESSRPPMEFAAANFEKYSVAGWPFLASIADAVQLAAGLGPSLVKVKMSSIPLSNAS